MTKPTHGRPISAKRQREMVEGAIGKAYGGSTAIGVGNAEYHTDVHLSGLLTELRITGEAVKASERNLESIQADLNNAAAALGNYQNEFENILSRIAEEVMK